MKTFRLTGLCAATVTPFDENGNLRLAQVGQIVDHLIQSGVKGLYVCGSTGQNLVGLKFTTPMLHQYQQCLELDDGRFDVLWGVDEMMLGALATGATGAIGSTYNVAAPVYLQIIDAFQRGDWQAARHWQARAILFIGILASYPFHSALREVMKLQGFNFGHCRLPIRPLTDGEAAQLKDELDAVEFFEWCHTDGDRQRLCRDAAHNRHSVKPAANSARGHERI